MISIFKKNVNTKTIDILKNESFFYELILILVIYSAKNKKQASAVELVNMLQVALSDANFVMDYQRLHPVADDVDILIQSVPKMFVHNFKLHIKPNYSDIYKDENYNFFSSFQR